jgi:hypothetical protein
MVAEMPFKMALEIKSGKFCKKKNSNSIFLQKWFPNANALLVHIPPNNPFIALSIPFHANCQSSFLHNIRAKQILCQKIKPHGQV